MVHPVPVHPVPVHPVLRAVPTPATAPACCVCGVATTGPFALCFCCGVLVEQLRLPLTPMVSMADYRLSDPLHRRLRGYKDAPAADARRAYRRELVGLVGTWLTANGQSLVARFGTRWDVVTTVPSSRRPGPAPVGAIVEAVPALADRHRQLLVRGSRPTGHLLADRLAFSPAPGAGPPLPREAAVLVVDDSVVTGARAQSAAAALRIRGIRVAGILVIGRARARNEPGQPKVAL